MTVRAELALWLLSCLLIAGSVALLRRELPIPPTPSESPAVIMPALPGAQHFDALAGGIVVTNPFRLDRRPAPVRFDPARRFAVQSGAVASDAPRPVLLLRAVVGGPPWEALIEGIPGRPEPALVRAGDTLGELVIQSIRTDSVIVAGMDTTWRLGLGARAWQ